MLGLLIQNEASGSFMISISTLLKKIDAELLFTDTDSLTYEIKSENVYEEFFKWKNLIFYHRYYSYFQHL